MDKLDILNRESFVDELIQLVENVSTGEGSVAFAIDGAWGCGKSFVLDMFERKLSQIQSEETSTDKYLIIRYNCWEYDYYEEPLIAIVATILDAINNKTMFLKQEDQEKMKGILKAAGTTLLSITNTTLKTTTGIDFSEAFDVVKSGIDAGWTEYEKMQEYDVFFGFKQTLYTLQNVLNKIGERQIIVFLIDELDRCLPEYAIKVLERLHHLSENMSKIINIVAIDKAKLKTSIRHIFGFENAEEYLRKFIQFSISLNAGTVSEKIADKFNSYTTMFHEAPIANKASIEECMQNLFKDIDIREQERLIQKAMLAHKILYKDPKDYVFMCTELLIVIVEFYYLGSKLFTNWYKRIDFLSSVSQQTTPFSPLFEERFNRINIVIKHHSGRNIGYKLECIFKNVDSLYSAIAYIWYELYLKEPNKYITIQNAETKDLLDKNVIELKKFIETVRLIK